MTDIDAIVKGLTKAQREALRMAWGELSGRPLRIRGVDGRSVTAMWRRDLVADDAPLALLTPLGLAVRDRIMQETEK